MDINVRSGLPTAQFGSESIETWLRDIYRRLEDLEHRSTTGRVSGSTPSGGGVGPHLPFVTIGNTPQLTAERALIGSDYINITDGGPNSSVSVSLDLSDLSGYINGLFLRLDSSNDPLTGDLDIVVDSAKALRVLPSEYAATEAWLSAGKILYTQNYSAASPTWVEVATPSSSNTSPVDASVPNFHTARITIDGSVLFSYHYSAFGRTAVYKTTTHRSATPSWSLVLASDSPLTLPGSYETGYIARIDTIDNYLLVEVQATVPGQLWWIGISADYGETFSWVARNVAHSPVSYIKAESLTAFFFDITHHLNSGALNSSETFMDSIYNSGASRAFRRGSNYDFLVGYQNELEDGHHTDRIRQISNAQLAYSNSDSETGNGQITPYLYSSYGAPSSSLPHVYYFDVHGVLHTWDGSAHVRSSTQPVGPIRDALYMGGGLLVHARSAIVSGQPIVYTSSDGGLTFSDATGNLSSFALSSAVNSLDLVFSFTDQDVFNVNTLDNTTRVYRLVSTALTGVEPLSVESTTLNENLNADLLDGQHASEFVPATRAINTTSPLLGGGDLSADRTISIPAASASSNGYLSSTDWSTFSGKQPAGNYLTALTGDVSATGPGSAAATLATVNASPGTYTYATVTVNAKGLVTLASAGTTPTTGSGASGRVTFWSGTSSLSSSANLIWNNASNNLGIGGSPFTVLTVIGSGGNIYLGSSAAPNVNKIASIVTGRYTSGLVSMFSADIQSGDHAVNFGGGLGGNYTATRVRFYTGADINATTGVIAMSIDNSQNVGIGIDPASCRLHVVNQTTTNNAALEVARIEARVSTASTGGSTGFGPAMTMYGESSVDGTYRKMAQMQAAYSTSTDASRKVTVKHVVTDYGGDRTYIQADADGSSSDVLINSLIYGSMYMDDGAQAVTATLANTYYEVGGGMTASLCNGTTFQNSKELLVTVAGTYEVDWSIALSNNNSDQTVAAAVMVNSTEKHTTENATRTKENGVTYSMGGTGIIALAVNDVVKLCVENETAAGSTITVNHANLKIVRIGE